MGLKKFNDFINEEEEKRYNFDDLSDDAKENAMEHYAYSDPNWLDYEWWDGVYEDFTEEMEKFGVYDIDISWSGFNSQGDGASFTSDKIESEIFLKKALDIKSNEFFKYQDDPEPTESILGDLAGLGFDEYETEKMDEDNFEFYIKRSDNRHVHENSVYLNMDYDDIIEFNPSNQEDLKRSMRLREFIDSIEDKGDEWLKEKCRELYAKLGSQFEALNSEENIRQNIIDSGIEFDEDGNIL